ncbi:MAG: ABC transporter permease [Acidobacteria bacterium]|nr:MAG: ABC transporter permease [Acidobacteriota bacterium]REK03631.1 MAG: ABC transporter permease [Acidobacteriota bacterium]
MRPAEAWVGFVTTVRKEVVRILRIWAQTILPPVITTTLYFIIFGPILGDRIGQMEGVTYLQYVTPGLIMMAVITNSYQNVVSSFFGAKFQSHVEEMLVSPMPDSAILFGYAIGGVFRGLLVGLMVSLTSLFFAALPVAHPMLTIAVAVLTSVAFSFGGFINALLARNFDDVAIVPTFVLTPLTMLGGVFYSVSLLPEPWRSVSFANPILYMVNAFRYGILGDSDIAIGLSLLILSGFIVLFYVAALLLLKRGTGLRA